MLGVEGGHQVLVRMFVKADDPLIEDHFGPAHLFNSNCYQERVLRPQWFLVL
jgi:hypothetical protein